MVMCDAVCLAQSSPPIRLKAGNNSITLCIRLECHFVLTVVMLDIS